MIYLINDNTDPAINFGIEEYFMKDTDHDLYSLWQNTPSVLLGKNQDAYAELDIDYARKNNVDIVRRKSGGGTIYCDLGNMQYSFVTQDDRNVTGRESFKVFARPIVEALKNLGLDAEFTGRNDILLGGDKVSGNAQYRYKGRTVHHGTLLYATDKDSISKLLYSRPIKFQNKSVKSVSSRVGQIKDQIDMDIGDFMDYISSYVVDYYKIEDVISLEDLGKEARDKISLYSKQFRDDGWNIGQDYSKNHHSFSIKYAYGLVEYKLRLKDGIIDSLYILGDYFEDEDVEELANRLIGTEFNKEDLGKALEACNVSNYIKGMDNDTLVTDLISIKA